MGRDGNMLNVNNDAPRAEISLKAHCVCTNSVQACVNCGGVNGKAILFLPKPTGTGDKDDNLKI